MGKKWGIAQGLLQQWLRAGACGTLLLRGPRLWDLQTQAIPGAWTPLRRSMWTWECLCELKPSLGAFRGLSVSNAGIKCASPHQSPADFLPRETRENRFSVRVVYFNMFLVFDWFFFFSSSKPEGDGLLYQEMRINLAKQARAVQAGAVAVLLHSGCCSEWPRAQAETGAGVRLLLCSTLQGWRDLQRGFCS